MVKTLKFDAEKGQNYWLDKTTGEREYLAPLEERPYTFTHGVAPYTMKDVEGYMSPCGTGWIEGRAARREDLKRNGCREVDPSEFKPVCKNREFARKHGLAWEGDA